MSRTQSQVCGNVHSNRHLMLEEAACAVGILTINLLGPVERLSITKLSGCGYYLVFCGSQSAQSHPWVSPHVSFRLSGANAEVLKEMLRTRTIPLSSCPIIISVPLLCAIFHWNSTLDVLPSSHRSLRRFQRLSLQYRRTAITWGGYGCS